MKVRHLLRLLAAGARPGAGALHARLGQGLLGRQLEAHLRQLRPLLRQRVQRVRP